MLKNLKINNSIILLLGIIIIFVGVFLGSFEYMKSKKEKAFSKMNLLLYDNENPKRIENDVPNQFPSIDNQDGSEELNGSENGDSNDQKKVYDYTGVLEIPKLNLRRGFYNIDSKYNDVDYNITVIRGSTFPDQENNNLILAAHSGNCSICYFKTLYKLVIGDIAYLTYKSETHTYKIVNIYEVEKNGTVAIYRNYNTKVLTLITCTKNNDYTQTVYILEIQD